MAKSAVACWPDWIRAAHPLIAASGSLLAHFVEFSAWVCAQDGDAASMNANPIKIVRTRVLYVVRAKANGRSGENGLAGLIFQKAGIGYRDQRRCSGSGKA